MGAEAPVGITALSAIGETPLVRLVRLPQSREAQVWVKLEMFNPTGSYKDRMALGLIEGAEARGELTPGRTVVERTRGSTGSSLALVCAVKGYPLKVVSSDAFSAAKLATMPALGAELIVVPSLDGGVTAELMEDMRCQVDRIVQDEDAFYTDQFNNPDSVVGYEPAGDEIIEQLGGPPDVFCAGPRRACAWWPSNRRIRPCFQAGRPVRTGSKALVWALCRLILTPILWTG